MPSSEFVLAQMDLQVQLINKLAPSSSLSPATPDGLLPNLVEKEGEPKSLWGGKEDREEKNAFIDA